MKNANINTEAKAKTMPELMEEIKANISQYNLSEDAAEKIELEVALKKLEEDYNELSMLTSWATFLEAENPMVAFAKAYTYPCVGHTDVPHRDTKNGVKTVVKTRVLNTDKNTLLNVAAFVDWTNEKGQCVARDERWKTKVADARDAIIAAWRKFKAAKGDKTQIDVGKMKTALQSMVDALVFIEGKNGGNAIVVKSSLVRDIFSVANTRKDGLKIDCLSKGAWAKLQMDILYAAVDNKEFTVIYGDEEAEEEAAEADEAAAK